ncbi:MAG: 50S ribosomal protein L25 [Synergistaceae bacterium]|nr:50S ribosomal protein L25 [Synergistaceae bacterium]
MATKQQNLKIEFTKRETTGKGVCKKLRSKDILPVVLYGPGFKDGLPGTVPVRMISQIANSERRETAIVELAMSDGGIFTALIRDVQRHPLTQRLRHIDFYQVLSGHKIKVEIPVHIINKEISPGFKEGGLFNQSIRLVTIEVVPSAIPESIVVDASGLEIGSEVFVKDLPLPEGSELITDTDILVLNIMQPKAASEEGTAAEEGTEEVEVVAKGKASKEEE